MRRAAVLFLSLFLAIPSVAYAGNGKKAYKKGIEYEEAQRWDRAAEQFALALSDEPNNTEYRLHYFRSISNASLMLTQRGDVLAEQKDYGAAYQAYRQAYSYDATNELARQKMNYALRMQGQPEVESADSILKAKYKRSDAAVEIPANRKIRTNVSFRNTSLKTMIDSLGESLGLSVIYDSDFKDRDKIDFEAKNITKAKALELILLSNKLFYTQVDSRAVLVAPDQPNVRTRYQQLAVRTFFLRNADVGEVRNLIATIVSTKFLVPNKQQNSLTVRDTPANLELIESIISSIDKDRAEVLIDVNLLEVDHDDMLQFGNQFNDAASGPGSQGSLSTFIGGIGIADALRSATPAGVFGPIGIGLALPTSTFRAFQSKGRSRILASTQVHVLDNEQHTIRIGSRVPIQTAQFVGSGTTVVTDRQNNNNNNNNNGFFGQPATQFQYENVGLNIDLQPVVHEDTVQIKMKIETSDVSPSSGVGGNPIFIQRQMSSVASIRDGQTTLIAGVSQENKNEGRRGIPFVSLLPVVGRLFTRPDQTKRLVDVVITVTPHILRAPTFGEEDNRAINAGTTVSPERVVPIEEIVYRAEMEEAQAARDIASATAPPRAAPPGNRPKTTEVELPIPGMTDSTRPVKAKGSEVISTPSGNVKPPVVSSEDSPQVKPASRPAPVRITPKPAMPVQPVVDDEDEDDDDEDDGDGGEANESGASYNLRLTGLQTNLISKPMPVAVYADGSGKVSSATVGIRIDEALVRVKKVESTGLFDGRLGGSVPFTVKGGMLYISLERPANMVDLPVNGQLVNIVFEVLGAGQVTLAIDPSSCTFVGPDTAPVAVRGDSVLTVTTR